MVIEVLCQYPTNAVMGISAGVGALAFAGYSIYIKKKENGKKFLFDIKKILDTTWQSAVAGVVVGTSIGCGYEGIITAMITGIGVDKIANRLKIGKTQVLNIAQLIAKFLTKTDKKRK